MIFIRSSDGSLLNMDGITAIHMETHTDSKLEIRGRIKVTEVDGDIYPITDYMSKEEAGKVMSKIIEGITKEDKIIDIREII